MSLNLMYNLGVETGRRFEIVCYDGAASQLLDLFDYGISRRSGNAPVGSGNELGRSGDINILLDSSYHSVYGKIGGPERSAIAAPWGVELYGFSPDRVSCSAFPHKLRSFRLPPRKVSASGARGTACCQMDTRSAHPGKDRFSTEEVDMANSMFGGRDSVHIGGPGTDAYTGGLRTHYAALREQSEFILGCSGFYGIDSGMSHLAGTLGMPGDVVIQNSGEFESLSYMYGLMYPSLRVHRRSVLEGVVGREPR
jgi:hypothetical protein